jgi:hypothetical protein
MAQQTPTEKALERLTETVDKIWQEIGGPPGQPGLKAKVEKQGAQIKGVAGVMSIIGAAFLGVLAKVFFFTQ